MSQKQYSERYQQKSSHLFDFGLYNVYDNNIINLSVGAPGPDLLANCCDIFNEATKHRLVSADQLHCIEYTYSAVQYPGEMLRCFCSNR